MIFVEAHASGFKEEFVKKTPLNNFLPCEGAEAHPSQPSQPWWANFWKLIYEF